MARILVRKLVVFCFLSPNVFRTAATCRRHPGLGYIRALKRNFGPTGSCVELVQNNKRTPIYTLGVRSECDT